MLTTEEALAVLSKERKVDVPYSTFVQWLRDERIPGAVRVKERRGDVWSVPEDELLTFALPRRGPKPRKSNS